MTEYDEPRAGYDVSELMWVEETTFKTTPTAAGTIWAHFGDPKRLAPAPNKTWRDRVGLGRQIPVGFTEVKKWHEPVIEYDILAKEATTSYEWIEALAAVLGEDIAGASGTADSGSSTTLVDDALTQDDDYWNGMILTIVAGTNIGESRNITDFVAATDTITVSPAFSAAIDATSQYVISAVSYDLEKRTVGRSIGAKLDLPTGSDDEYWIFKGCKTTEFELFSEMDGTVHVREHLIAIGACDYNTTDYVSGSATRKTFPTTEPIVNGDCDIHVEGASIFSDVQSWRFRVARELEKHGSQSGAGTLFDKAIEKALTISLEVTMDFVSTTHLNQFLDATKFYAELEIPYGSGGRLITLSTSGDKQAVWKTATKPARELDLIGLTLTAEFDTLAVTTIA